jgi:hypothetical protein
MCTARKGVLVAVFAIYCGCAARPTAPIVAGDAVVLPQSANDRAGWRKALHWSEECEAAHQATGGAGELQVYPLETGKSLVEVPCAAGAYQGSQQYFLVDASGSVPVVHALSFRTYEASGPEGTQLQATDTREISGLAEFDRTHQLLKVLNKFRGPGDCGSYAVYSFQSDRAVLKEFRAKVQCDGQGAEHPETWPLHP